MPLHPDDRDPVIARAATAPPPAAPALVEGPVELLVRGAGHLWLAPGLELPDGWLAVAGGRVVGYGRDADPAPAAARTLDAGGRVLTPGLVNTHHHIYQNLTRAFAPAIDGSLFAWLTELYPRWARLDQEAVHVSATIGMAELLLGGCTTSTDHLYVHPRPGLIDAEIAAAREIGFRFLPTRGSMSRSVEEGFLPPKSVVQGIDAILEDSERLIREYHDPEPGALIRVGLGPCSPFTVDAEIMRASAELSERHGVRLHTHLAEDHDEDAFCQSMYGMRPVEFFEESGWANERAWVAHFIYPNRAEVDRLAAAGVGAAHCPSSNMILAHGSARVQDYRAAGLNVGLGCDGSASADAASLWQETRNAMLLARLFGGPGAMTAREALEVATLGGARNLGWDDEIGHLRIGALADFVLWQQHEVAWAGVHSDPVAGLLRTGPASAWATSVGGRLLVEGGELRVPGLEAALADHRRISRSLQAA